MKTLHPLSRIALLVSALMLISAYYVPLWQILMWAPQYPEGLGMKIWINNITGDVKIISALNHYIGMKHIEVSMFPEFGFMVYIVAGVIGLGLVATIINKRFALITYTLILLGCGVAALVDFYLWGYDYGHNLDPTAAIIVPGMSYQPPLIGTKQLLNFTAFSGPDVGGWIFMISFILVFVALAFEVFKFRFQKNRLATGLVIVSLASVTSCSVQPQPIQYGKDACHHCKMTLMDDKFGAEIVSKKGKVFVFDDVNCFVGFIKKGTLSGNEIAHYLVTDFASPGTLTDAQTATYVLSEEISTPMASNIAGFKDDKLLEQYNAKWNGKIMRWEELLTDDTHN